MVAPHHQMLTIVYETVCGDIKKRMRTTAAMPVLFQQVYFAAAGRQFHCRA
jgi:hypothetical protein